MKTTSSHRMWSFVILLFRKEMFSLKLNKQVVELFKELSLNYIGKDILSDDIFKCCTESEKQVMLRKLGML